jgi:GWxTD domain-containing protein
MIRFLTLLLLGGGILIAQDEPVYFQAEDAFFASDFRAALKLAQQVPQSDQYYANAQILIGHSYLKLEVPDSAETVFYEIVKKDNTNPMAFNGLGLVYLSRISDSKRIIQLLKGFFSESDEERAERMFLRALKYDEKYPDARFNLARVYLLSREEGKHAMAENLLRGLAGEQPQNVIFTYHLAQAYIKTGKYDLAEQAFQRIQQVPGYRGRVNLERAMLAFNRKDYNAFSGYYLAALTDMEDEESLLRIFRDCYDLLSTAEIDLVRDKMADGAFWMNFWQRRDPNPVTDINERLILHYQRLDHARGLWGEDNLTGYDDRGMIYIRYGEPLEKYAGNSIGMNVDDNESWVYKIAGKNISFDFIEQGATFRLVNDLSEAVNSTNGVEAMTALTRLYEQRSHLSGPYTRIANELSSAVITKTQDLRIETVAPTLARFSTENARSQKSIPQSTFNYAMEGSDLPFDINYSWFYEDGRPRLELYYALNRSAVTGAEDGLDSGTELKESTVIRDENFNTLVRGSNTVNLANRFKSGNAFISQVNAYVRASKVKTTLQLEIPATNQVRMITVPVVIDSFYSDKLNLSGIEIADEIRPARASDTKVFVKNNLYVQAFPYTGISKSKPVFLYFEIYNLETDAAGVGEYQVELQVVRDSDSQDFTSLLKALNPFASEELTSVSTTFAKNSKSRFMAEYIGLDLGELSEGRYRLTVRVTDMNSSETRLRRLMFDLQQ